jgi:hypothetical protein
MDAHSPEYAAAVSGMQDAYGRPAPSAGDWINGNTCGKPWAGRVLEVRGDQVLVDLDGAILQAPLSDIARP